MPPLLSVRVTPKAARNHIKSETLPDGTERLRVYVTTVAEGGKANEAVLALLATHLGIAKKNLTLVHGATTRDKLFRVNQE
jgi:hypothetical protein